MLNYNWISSESTPQLVIVLFEYAHVRIFQANCWLDGCHFIVAMDLFTKSIRLGWEVDAAGRLEAANG